MLFLVFQVEKKKPAIGRGSIVHPARDPMIREFTLPGHAVNLFNRVTQLELLVQRPRERDTNGRTGTHAASCQQVSCDSDLDRILLDVNFHDFDDSVNRLHLLLFFLFLVPRYFDAVVL